MKKVLILLLVFALFTGCTDEDAPPEIWEEQERMSGIPEDIQRKIEAQERAAGIGVVRVVGHNMSQDVTVTYRRADDPTWEREYIHTGSAAEIARIHYQVPVVGIINGMGERVPDETGEYDSIYVINDSRMRVMLHRDGEIFYDKEQVLYGDTKPWGHRYELGLAPEFKPGVPQTLGFTIYVPRDVIATAANGETGVTEPHDHDWVEFLSDEVTVTLPEIPKVEIKEENIAIDNDYGTGSNMPFVEIGFKGLSSEEFLLNPEYMNTIQTEGFETDTSETFSGQVLLIQVDDKDVETPQDHIIVKERDGELHEVTINVPREDEQGLFFAEMKTTITGENIIPTEVTIHCDLHRLMWYDQRYDPPDPNDRGDRKIECEIRNVESV